MSSCSGMRVLAGQIEAYVDQLSSSLPHPQSGKLRAGRRTFHESSRVADILCRDVIGVNKSVFGRAGRTAIS